MEKIFQGVRMKHGRFKVKPVVDVYNWIEGTLRHFQEIFEEVEEALGFVENNKHHQIMKVYDEHGECVHVHRHFKEKHHHYA